MPHITLAFPFKKDISNEELKKQLLKITKNIKPFTLGNTNNFYEKIELNDEFETIVDSIVIEQIGENEESIIESEIKL